MFIHGCIKTDTPDLLSKTLEEVQKEIENDIYFNKFHKKFKKSGFHATENHPDIKTALYRRLIKLNWRAYFVVVNKNSDYYKSRATQDEHVIFMTSLTKLLFDRIRSSKDDKNIFIFETIQLSTKSLESVLSDFFEQMNKVYDCEYSIVQKDGDINLAIIDYLNFVIYKILDGVNKDLVEKEPVNKQVRMRQNFEIFAPKIAMIHIQNTKTYLSRYNDDITIENLIKNW